MSNLPLANRYRETAIKTANPLQLIVILYDGAIQSLQQAREHIKRKDIENRARCLNRCVAIITELQACLNFNASGEIAASLDRLYDFMKQGIFKASLEQRTEPIDQIIALLDNLRSAWGELANQSNIQPAASLKTAASATAMIQNIPAASSHPGALNICG